MTLTKFPLTSIRSRCNRYQDSLTEQQTAELRSIYDDFGRFAGGATFEQFERDFLFERNVAAEIIQWSRMANTLRRCIKRFPSTDREAATNSVIALSLGVRARPHGVSKKAYRFLRKHVPLKPLKVVVR